MSAHGRNSQNLRTRYLEWIQEGQGVREEYGLLAEWVLEPSNTEGNTVVVTVWPSHEVFDTWIATPERDALTMSEVHQSVVYRPITRYDLIGGYTNLAALNMQNQITLTKETEK